MVWFVFVVVFFLLGETIEDSLHSLFFTPSPDKAILSPGSWLHRIQCTVTVSPFHHHHLPALPKVWCHPPPLLPWQSAERVGTCQKEGGEGQKMSRCSVLKAVLKLHILYACTRAKGEESRVRTAKTVWIRVAVRCNSLILVEIFCCQIFTFFVPSMFDSVHNARHEHNDAHCITSNHHAITWATVLNNSVKLLYATTAITH